MSYSASVAPCTRTHILSANNNCIRSPLKQPIRLHKVSLLGSDTQASHHNSRVS